MVFFIFNIIRMFIDEHNHTSFYDNQMNKATEIKYNEYLKLKKEGKENLFEFVYKASNFSYKIEF